MVRSVWLLSTLGFIAACSGNTATLPGDTAGTAASAGRGGRSGSGSGGGGSGGSGGRAESGTGGASGWTGDPGIAGGNSIAKPTAGAPAPSGPASCAKQTARATQKPVFLAFAFDVSGSMGKGDKPWHDRQLKWEPVVTATKAFFQDPKSEGFSASLTFFPADGDDDERCEAASYQKPEVALQTLPSNAFGEALDEIGMEDWRGGTPTLFVVQGVFDQIAAAQMEKPGRYALVLVTDGYPQDCDDDSIESVAKLVASKAADVSTYVIGVTNPPIEDAPDVTTNLADIAKAGGTGNAYLIDTGNPNQTATDFKRTIDSIRSAAVSCNLPIPEAPAGQTFDKKKVSVKYTGSGNSGSGLAYDAECKASSSWHYDNADQPREIVLCPDTCKTLQMDSEAELAVDFECEQVILGPL